MEKEQIFQTIEAYLDGALGAEELTAFEQELATDPDLVREVELHRRLQQELGDAEKTKLRLALEEIAGEFAEPEEVENQEPPDSHAPDKDIPGPENGGQAGGLPFWMWGLGFFLIIGGGVVYYLTGLTDDDNSAVSTIEATEPPIDEESTAMTDNTEEAEPRTPEAPETTTADEAPAVTTAPGPDPKVFATNQDLELQMKDGASKRYVFTEGNLEYLQQDQQGYLNFSAKLETSRSVEEGLFLTLYNNQYPEGQVLRGPLQFDEISGERKIAFGAEVKQYLAAYSEETKLEPALYYGVITVGSSSVPLWVGKVRVE